MPRHLVNTVIRFRRSGFAAALLFVLISHGAISAQNFRTLYNFQGPCCATYPSPLTQARDGNLYGVAIAKGRLSLNGSVYRITPDGRLQIVHNFSGTDLYNPGGSLILGDDGSLYGTTRLGGTYQGGTLFKITPDGTLRILYSFTGGADGAWPYGALVRGQDGNFYGTSVVLPGAGYVIFKATPGGEVTSLYTLDVNHAPRSLIEGSDGNFYGTGGQGNNNGSVFRVTPSGEMTELYNFDGLHGASPVNLVRGPRANYFGITAHGGTTGGGVFFAMTPGGTLTVLHNFDSSNTADGYWPMDLILASDGNFYGTTLMGGAFGYGVIYRISANGNYHVLHNFDKANGANPTHLRQHTNGKIYGSASTGGPYNNGTLYEFDAGLSSFVILQPTSGRVGTDIGILGTGLLDTRAVHFQGSAGTFQINLDSYLTTTVPDQARTGYVKVHTQGRPLQSDTIFEVLP
jgi:uncharacterized repeat protein (TIGR03803 family)